MCTQGNESNPVSFVGSYPTTFTIGHLRKEFYVHEALLKQHFPSLWDFCRYSNRTEAAEFFKTIEADTFVRFVEFAYTGDYSVPHLVPFATVNGDNDSEEASVEPAPDASSIVSEPESFPPAEAPEEAPEDAGLPIISEEAAYEPAPLPEASVKSTAESAWGPWDLKKKKRRRKEIQGWDSPPELPAEEIPIEQFAKKTTKKENLWNSFISEAEPKVIPPWEPDTSEDVSLDFSPVLLSHASLYVFSDRFAMLPLRQLTLDKLRLTLSRLDLFSERTDAIVQLLKYTYTENNTSEDDTDKLRELVIDYVTCHLESLAQNHTFLDILQEPGALCKDLMLKVLNRLD